MVRGLDLFRDYFKDYTDKYILIGGTACDLAMENMGLDFRATKDLDIVLVLEALDVQFVNAFRGFIKEGQKVTDDLSIISQEYLIPLKSRAWLDLCKIKSSGETIDSKDIKKHKNDVFRLYQILSLDTDIALPQSIADDMRMFLDKVSDEPPDLKNLGIRNTSLAEIIGNLKKIYKL